MTNDRSSESDSLSGNHADFQSNFRSGADAAHDHGAHEHRAHGRDSRGPDSRSESFEMTPSHMRDESDSSGPSFGDEPGASSDPLIAASAGSVARDDAGTRPKRRRGTRGGRRRRGARKNAGDPGADVGADPSHRNPADGAFEADGDSGDDDRGEVQADTGAPEDVFESGSRSSPESVQLVPGGPARKRKRRGGRRGRGRGADRDDAPASGPVEPDLPGESDDFVARPAGGVPRELDAFEDDFHESAPHGETQGARDS
jgi:hypothetical protein